MQKKKVILDGTGRFWHFTVNYLNNIVFIMLLPAVVIYISSKIYGQNTLTDQPNLTRPVWTSIKN
ncbi:hypothetical protein Hanom_Chr12g01174831 [Helianthus anomalus]